MKQRLAFLVVGAFLWTSLLAQERVKFTLDWVIDGQQTPFFLTQGRGYFREQGLNVTLAGRNVASWTPYHGMDPEGNSRGQMGASMLDLFTQPPVRYWTARLDVEF